MRTSSGARGRRRLPLILLLTLAAFGGALLSATANPQSVAAQPAADLTIAKTCTPPAVASGGFAECEIVISNIGTLPAFFPAVAPIIRDVITDTTPLTTADVTVPVRPANVNCTVTPQGANGTLVICSPANSVPFLLLAGANARFVVRQSFVNTGTTPQQVCDTATVDPNGFIQESNENNNSASACFTVNPVPPALPDLSVTKACTPPSIASGSSVICTVTVTNAAGAGPANVPVGAVLVQDRFTGTAATNATITGAGPAGFTCDPQTSEGGSLVVNCRATSATTLAPGASLTFTFTQTASIVSGTTAQPVTNFARVDPNGTIPESSESNNDSNVVTTNVTPPPLPDLVIGTKTCSAASAPSGTPVTCTVTVTNAAGAAPAVIPANAVLVQDVITGTALTSGTVTGTGPAGYTCAADPTPPAGSAAVNCFPPAGDTIAPGASRTFTFTQTFTLSGTTPQTVTDFAVADPDGAINESNENNNTSNTVSTTITPPPPDLTIGTKTCSAATVASGTPFTCTVTVTNAGPGPVVVPAGVPLVADVITGTANTSGTVTGVGTGAASGYTCSLDPTPPAGSAAVNCFPPAGGDTIPQGGTRSFTFTQTFTIVSGPGPETVSDFAVADPDNVINESNNGNNTSNTVTTTITLNAGDLDLTKSCTPTTIVGGADSTCTVTITNTGPGAVTVPAGATLFTDDLTDNPAATADNFANSPATLNFTCTAVTVLPETTRNTCVNSSGAPVVIANGATLTFFFQVSFTPTSSGTATQTATLDPALAGPTGPDSGSVTLTIQPGPNLTVTKDCPAGPVASGATFTCTIVITNSGAAAAAFTAGQRVLNDLISSTVVGSTVGVQGFTVSVVNLSCNAGGPPPGPPGTVNPGNPVNVDCNATGPVTIAPGGTITVTFNQVATNPGPGNSTVSDTATADPDNVIPEGNEGDNTATDSLQVLPQAAGDLTVDKSCTPATIPSGGTSNCTIVITNNVAAGNVVVDVGDRVLRDVLEIPAGVTVTNFTLTPPSALFDCDGDVTLFSGGSGVEGGPITGPANIRFICTRTGSGFTFTPGFSITFTAVISATNASNLPGNLVNRVRVNPNDDFIESTTANNNDNFTIVVSPGVGDLDISKVCTPVSRPSGAASNCTITIVNSSATSPVTVPPGGILLRDDVAFPAALTPTNVQDTSAPAGYSCSEVLFATGVIRVTCSNIGVAADVIAPGGTRTFVITQVFTNNSGASQTVTDTATENPGGGQVINETTPGETATFTTTVLTAVGDLDIDKVCTSSATPVPSGTAAFCTITIVNSGPAAVSVASGARIVNDRVPFPAGVIATNVSGVQAADPQTPAGATATCASTAESGSSGGAVAGPNAINVLCTATAAFILAPGQEIVFTVTQQFTNNTAATVPITDTATENPFGDIAETTVGESDSDVVNVASGASTLTATKTCAPFVSVLTFYTINCTISVQNTGANSATFDVGDTVLADTLGPIPGSTTVTGFTITATNSTQNCVLVAPIPPFPGAGPGASLTIRCDLTNTAVTLTPGQSFTYSVVINGNETGSGQVLPNTIRTNPDGDIPNVPLNGGPFTTNITFP